MAIGMARTSIKITKTRIMSKMGCVRSLQDSRIGKGRDMLSLRFLPRSHLHSINLSRTLSVNFGQTLFPFSQLCALRFSSTFSSRKRSRILYCGASFAPQHSQLSTSSDSPFLGLEDDLVGYVFGKRKATEVAHSVWKHVVRKGDTVIDATCGNGYDTLAMLQMVADESGRACVYGMDIQGNALENTSSLLDENFKPEKKKLVKLFDACHSRMEEIIPEKTSVRLVAFNLGYLPGGDKTKITISTTTLLALEAAERILMPGGLISLVVYVGHPGGREELETVEAFASKLSVDDWICCKFQMLNRPLAPVLIFLFKR